MATCTFYLHSPPEFMVAYGNNHKLSTVVAASWTMSKESGYIQTKKKREELSLHLHHPPLHHHHHHHHHHHLHLHHPAAAFNPQRDPLRLPHMRFNRLQIPDDQENKMEFGNFVARNAIIDEEYWTAAWLRAEALWEAKSRSGMVNTRFGEQQVIDAKRRYTEQEFHAIRNRIIGPYGNKCICIITVRKHDGNVKRTVLKSVVATLDLSIRCLLPGERYPEEHGRSPQFCSMDGAGKNRYSYITSLVVSKSARGQGIASNMMQFAIGTAKSNGGVEHMYVHVDRSNKLAQKLYEKMRFEMVEEANDGLVEDDTYLLRLKLVKN